LTWAPEKLHDPRSPLGHFHEINDAIFPNTWNIKQLRKSYP
jgi:hypothetical protein